MHNVPQVNALLVAPFLFAFFSSFTVFFTTGREGVRSADGLTGDQHRTLVPGWSLTATPWKGPSVLRGACPRSTRGGRLSQLQGGIGDFDESGVAGGSRGSFASV